MPVKIEDTYKQMSGKKAVLAFLRDRPLEWYSAAEISENIGLSEKRAQYYLGGYLRTRPAVQWRHLGKYGKKEYRWDPCQ